MKFCSAPLIAVALWILVPAFAVSESLQQQPDTVPVQDQAAAAAQTTLPAQAQGSAPLRVMVDKSLLINTTERLKRISASDPTVAFATVITPTQILVHGRAPGEVSLLFWYALEHFATFDFLV